VHFRETCNGQIAAAATAAAEATAAAAAAAKAREAAAEVPGLEVTCVHGR